MSTGELADALRRDLLSDRLSFDELGWRGLWAYVTTAPPGTALYHARSGGWTVGDYLAAEKLDVFREILWRYIAIHFEGGTEAPFPDRVPRPGDVVVEAGPTWDAVDNVTDLMSPKVLEMMRGA